MSAITLASDLIRRSEGLRIQAYWDPDGKVWTVGYGATGPGIVQGTVWTPEQAALDLQRRLVVLVGELQKDIHYWPRLSQAQQAAILDWTYNLGIGRLLGSTLDKYIEAGQLASVPSEIVKWVYAGGHILAGLVARRAAEVALWNESTYEQTSGVAIVIS